MIGILLMAYGAAADLEDLPRYYTHIRHGHPPTPEQLENLTDRYRAIGGHSPLLEITEAEANALSLRLNQDQPGAYKVYLGLKHAAPFIADGVEAMVRDGVTKAVGIVLAPHYSRLSVGDYLAEVEAARTQLHADFLWHGVKNWHVEPLLIEALARRIRSALKNFGSDPSIVIFTAHSLPQSILKEADPYPQQLRETGEALAQYLALPQYTFSWQSAGRTKEPWMGPDILHKMSALASEGWVNQLVCPVGFVSDHLEILYDLDIEAKHHAEALGVHLERTLLFNADPEFTEILAHIVFGALS